MWKQHVKRDVFEADKTPESIMWDFMHGAMDGVPAAGVIHKVNGLRA
jgi:hypothetical protein